jgi:peptidoglycan/LPS O-acetylase OafA/YrhL
VGENPQLRYEPALDGLRALAVGAVFAYHLSYGWASGGFLGVDAFFVLSGFLITSLLLAEWRRSGTIAFRSFWIRRARRLLPALLLVLVAVAIYAATSVPSDQLGQLRGDGLATLFYGANWRFIATGQSYFTLFTTASPLRHMWSLAIEEQFYLVWPLVAFVCLRLVRGRRWLLAAVCGVGAVASSLVMAWVYSPANPSRAYYGTDSRAQLLLIGGLLAVALARWSPRAATTRAAVSCVGVAGIAYCFWAWAEISDTASWMYRGGYFVFGIAVAAVITSVVQPDRPRFLLRRALSLAPVVWVGRVSYGLYLWHWPVIVYVTPERTGLAGWRLALLRVGLTVAIATVSFYLVELPIRRGRLLAGRRLGFALPTAFVGAGVAVVLATSSATPLPPYLRGPTNNNVLAAASGQQSLLPSRGAARTLTPTAPHRILLMGDSLAVSLLPGLEHAASSRGLEIASGAFDGCGLMTGSPLDPKGQLYPWSDACSNALPFIEHRAIFLSRPDLVIWLSGAWDERDRFVDGKLVRLGSPRGDRIYSGLVDAAVHRLTSGGARIVFVTTAPEPRGAPDLTTDPVRNRRTTRLDAVLRRYAATHRIELVDLSPIVCPKGPPCPAVVDHLQLRPDGYHFDDASARWVAQRLLPRLVKTTAPPARTRSVGTATSR